MPDSFDPYYKWFGISPKDQPPNHYRLLGLDRFEADPDVIESAADRQMSHLRSFQTGAHAALSQKLLNEVAAAKLCLLDAARRAAYDQALRATAQPAIRAAQRSEDTSAAPITASVPVSAPERDIAGAGRPLWQEPVLIASAAAGLSIGTVVAGALLLLSLGKPSMAPSGDDMLEVPSEARTIAAEEKEANPAPPVAAVLGAEVSAASSAEATQSSSTTSHRPAFGLNGSENQPVDSGRTGPGLSSELPVAQPKPKPTYRAIGEPMNLLAGIDLGRDVVKGEWRQDGQDLISPERTLWARVMLPCLVPEEYLLTVVVDCPKRRSGFNENFNLGLVGRGNRQFMYCITAYGKGGLFLLDGKEWHVNETSHAARGVLKTGENVIACIVRTTGLEARVNDRTFIDWKDNFGRLSVQPAWQCPNTSVLFLGTCCDYRFTKVELQAIRSLSE